MSGAGVMTYPTLPTRRRRNDFRQSRAWRKLRDRVLVRDRYLCQWGLPGCLVTATQGDHVVPWSRGGAAMDERNVVAACGPCNNKRNDGRSGEFLRGTELGDRPFA